MKDKKADGSVLNYPAYCVGMATVFVAAIVVGLLAW